jgi:hypothetical protein
MSAQQRAACNVFQHRGTAPQVLGFSLLELVFLHATPKAPTGPTLSRPPPATRAWPAALQPGLAALVFSASASRGTWSNTTSSLSCQGLSTELAHLQNYSGLCS